MWKVILRQWLASIDEESKSSDDLENVYNGIQNLESTTLDNVEGSHGPVHQYNRMTLRSSRKSRQSGRGEIT